MHIDKGTTCTKSENGHRRSIGHARDIESQYLHPVDYS